MNEGGVRDRNPNSAFLHLARSFHYSVILKQK